MNSIKLCGLWLFAMLACGKTPTEEKISKPEPEKPMVKVMTYNIYGARGGGIPDLKVIADVIKAADPDLVALQEVDKNTTRNQKNGDIAKELGRLTGMEYFFAKAINTFGGEYGDAVLSRLPIKQTKAYTMGVTPQMGGELRSVACIAVEKDAKPFYFISTHFDHLGQEDNRLLQAAEFTEIVKNLDKPVIVGGDFNAVPTSMTVAKLKEQLVLGCRSGCGFTAASSSPNRTIDYLFYSPVGALTVRNYSVFTEAYTASDHLPVVATFEIND